MKRNVLKVGRSSFAISLPKNFVRTNNLKSGQEIEVLNQGSSLMIMCINPVLMAKTVDISEFSTQTEARKLLDKILGALFRQGLNKFSLICSDRDKAKLVRDILRDGKLQMYEEPGMQDDTSVIVHSSISNFDAESLQNMTSSIIKHIYRTIEEFTSALREGSLTAKMAEEFATRDRTINDQTDICKRIVNKNAVDYKSTSYYSIIDKLEKIGDEIKSLALYAAENPRAAKRQLALIEKSKEIFYMLYMTNNSFSVKKMNSFFALAHEIELSLEKCGDAKMYHHLKSLVLLVRDTYSDLMVKEL
jgi:phosphate uptake regulator